MSNGIKLSVCADPTDVPSVCRILMLTQRTRPANRRLSCLDVVVVLSLRVRGRIPDTTQAPYPPSYSSHYRYMWLRIYECTYGAYRILIPYPEDRIPITRDHVFQLALPFVPFLYMAYLSRRPDTFLVRLMLLPVVVSLAFGTYFRYMWPEPEYNLFNWGQGLLAETISAKAIDFAWRRPGMLKLGEIKPGLLMKPSVHEMNGGTPYASESSNAASQKYSLLPSWLHDTMEVILTTRGIGWHFGSGIHIPQEHRPLERPAFLRRTLVLTIQNFLVFDALESFIKLIPHVGSPHGGTIFNPDLPIPKRYILSTAINLATGSCLVAGFEMVYGFITIFSITVLSSTPSMWPPIMDHPWRSDSLHIFWAKRWHQVLRETFFIYGGFLGKIMAGNLGMIFGTFLGSGIYHEFSAYTLGRGFDFRVVLFFVLQAPLLLLERLWRRISGRRVGGFYGRLWVYFCIVILGQPLADSWHRRGLGGGLIIPPCISPARRLLIPLLRRVSEMADYNFLSTLSSR
ncbi:hypothetical protein F5I97DRAFT_1884429 [Phlebopus sp. FC_14]|nr:hypothetical protein F5I97DRAFT_1884429 [Phlebopus sp. FC_14]